MDRVVAIIVTYNRPEFLRKLLLTLNNEDIEKIIVVDNSEKKYEYFLPNNALLISTDNNLGGAGGYALGIKRSAEFNPDFLWLLDDDAIPQVGALKILLDHHRRFKQEGIDVGYLCSKVLWADTNELCKMNIPTFVKNSANQVLSCSFVSILIQYDKIIKVGLPYKEFFIWYDDVEYTNRLSKISFGLFVEDSIVRHYTSNNLGADFGYINDSNIIKYAHGIRNTVFCHIKDGRFKKLYRLFFRVRREMLSKSIPKKYRFFIYKWYLKGMIFHPTVEYLTN